MAVERSEGNVDPAVADVITAPVDGGNTSCASITINASDVTGVPNAPGDTNQVVPVNQTQVVAGP